MSNKLFNKRIYTSCISKEETLLCKIKKSKVKMKFGRNFTIYKLYTEFTNKFLMSCKKISNFTNTEYIFTLDENPIECCNNNKIGKLISQFFGNVYDIYDMSGNKIDDRNLKSTANILVGTIEYVIFFMILLILKKINLLGLFGPRVMKVYIPLIEKYNEKTIPSCKVLIF